MEHIILFCWQFPTCKIKIALISMEYVGTLEYNGWPVGNLIYYITLYRASVTPVFGQLTLKHANWNWMMSCKGQVFFPTSFTMTSFFRFSTSLIFLRSRELADVYLIAIAINIARHESSWRYGHTSYQLQLL